MDLEAKQREMKARMARQRKRANSAPARSRAPKLAVLHGLITTGTPGIHPPKSEVSEHQTDMHALVLEFEAEMRRERQKKAKEKQ